MKTAFAVATAALLLLASAAGAQEAKPADAKPTATNPAEPAEHEAMAPGLGEIMSLQQMRHIKLWFAGHAGNWELADYEVDELKEGFEDVEKLLGGDIVEKAVGAQIKALEKVIDDKDRAAFPAAFDKLTAGCNGCHKLLEHGFIAIQRPSALPYSDQDFTPQKKK